MKEFNKKEFAASRGSELVKGCWIAVNDVSDIPRINSVVVYATSIPHNLENLFCSVGYLSWSEDFSYGSIIDDGEVVGLSHVKMIYLIDAPFNDVGVNND